MSFVAVLAVDELDMVCRRNIACVVFLWLMTGLLGSLAFAVPFTATERQLLVENLKSKVWSTADLQRIYANKRIEKIADMVKMNVTKPIQLTHERYAHFAYKPAIKRSKRFRKKWRSTLARAARKYGVDRDVIVAILLVETNLGRYGGTHNVMNVYSSVFVDSAALLTHKKVGDPLYKRIVRKKKWALRQLKSLLRMSAERGVNLIKLHGSYAGAFGLCQFLPSSYLAWAVRAKGGGPPDLFWQPDAIYSVGNYLKKQGFKSGKMQAKRKAIWHYNNSDVYVDTVLAVANKLK